MRPTGSLIPGGCAWYKTSIAEFNPEKNLVLTTNGDEVTDLFLQFAFYLKLFINSSLGITCNDYQENYQC